MMPEPMEWVQLEIQVNEQNEFFVPEDYEPSWLDNLEKENNND